MKAIHQISNGTKAIQLHHIVSLIQRLNILILYDVDTSGNSAMALYQRLMKRLDEGYFFELKLWRFDLLDFAETAQLASRDLARADMVIVAWNRPMTGLSLHDAWIQRWPASFSTRRLLVSLFTGSRGETGKRGFACEWAFLRALARRTGMDLISSLPKVALSV